MTLRRHLIALVAVLVAPAFASAATYSTDNFTVTAPTAELAKKFGEMAEYYRKEKAKAWLGREMPQWPQRCPLSVQIVEHTAGGATTFSFGNKGGKPVVTSMEMEIRGEVKKLLDSVLPHEVTHTVLAHHFGRAVPRWADEGGSVLSENEEECFKHDVSCRELLNAGRGYQCRVLFQMTEYPRDVRVLYAQGYSLSHYLVKQGGDGHAGRVKLLEFLAIGMSGTDPRDRGQFNKKFHGSPDSWNEAAKKVYGYDNVDELQEAWLTALKTPPSRVAARDTSRDSTPAGLTSGNKTELRSSAAPTAPLLEPPVKVARGAAPEHEPARPPTTGSSPIVRQPLAPTAPPPSLLGPPDLLPPVKR